MVYANSGTLERPQVIRFLGGSEYAVWLAESGAGAAVAGDLMLTAASDFRSDIRGGLRVFVRNQETGKFALIGQNSSSYNNSQTPTAASAWRPGVFSIFENLDGVVAQMDVCVVPGTPAELRQVTLRNDSDQPRTVDLTTYAEVVLNHGAAHQAHPVFSKLFLQTEYDPARTSLQVRRRRRDARDSYPRLVHAFLGSGDVQWETSRPAFLGRGRPPLAPAALTTSAALSGTTGNVLDPIVSLRWSCRLAPGEHREAAFVLGTAKDADEAARCVDSLRAPNAVAKIFAEAATDAAAQLAQAGLTAQDEEYIQDLAGVVLGGHHAGSPHDGLLIRSGLSRDDLVRLGLSLDRDWVVVHAETREGAATQAQMVRAARRWRELALPIQLVIVNGDRSEPEPTPAPSTGDDEAILRLGAADLTPAEFQLLNLAARLVITESLPEIVTAMMRPRGPSTPLPAAASPATAADSESLRFFNGWGGFNNDGDEYVIRLRRTATGRLDLPPLPWVNVVANDQFGFLVSETGAGCAWYGNSRENRLTPWSNDTVRDPHGDAFYLRDEETGAGWSCLPGPRPGAGDYEVRHGFGYTRFVHRSDDLALDTTMFATRTDPLRVTRISVTNDGERRRRISLFGCAQLVLGGEFRSSSRFVTTWQDDQTGALLARNPLSASCPWGVAFAALVTDPAVTSVHHSCSLAGFLGPDRDFADPAALRQDALDDQAAPETESGFAHQAVLELEPGRTATVSFLLGQEADADWARDLVIRHRSPAAIEGAWRQAIAFWREGLSGLRIETPSPALDLMVNGWLPYQTLSCRIRGRTAFYQSGGAFGFRDQLQDASSLVPLWPEKTRQQILLHAAHQFGAGDVLHWWHPPHNRGIRTRFADDLLWLPLLTAEYIASTGDEQILSEDARYLRAPDLEPGQDEVFLHPVPSGETGDTYDHCCRAIDRSLQVGAHGLPLFGAGDWNDGMNRVGREGRGESVWMGFFLVMVLDGFGPLCANRGDQERADRYAAHRRKLAQALNDGGWDGRWYRRGYYDDGAPLGSHQNAECRIDALAQAWAVLSEVAPSERAAQALTALEENLVLEDPGLIKLLTPPFADTPHDPGYIKGYVPGVRENGGQYTHAALWVVRAMAKARRRDKAAHFLDLLNPIRHASTPDQVAVYQAEPYVVAADVYGADPHLGRGGWTWYTGSSGWMHRAAVESVLGLRQVGGDTLVLEPCIPDDWPGYTLTWNVPDSQTIYRITVGNPQGCSAAVIRATLDGAPVACAEHAVRIPLGRDDQTHHLDVTLGAPNPETGAP